MAKCLCTIVAVLLLCMLLQSPVGAQLSSGAPGGMAGGGLPGLMGLGDLANHRPNREDPANIIKDARHAMADADPKTRLSGLGKLRDVAKDEATTILLTAMADPDIRVKIKAIDILGERRTVNAVQPMAQALFLRLTDPVEKLHLVAALGRIADPRGALPVMHYFRESEDERSRGTALFALGEIGDPRAIELLTQTLSDHPSPTVRRLATEALEKIGGELPTARAAQLAEARQKRLQPADERLSKLRELDQKIQEANH